MRRSVILSVHHFFFFFTHTATTEIYTLSLHDALPICSACRAPYQADPGDLLALGIADATGVELWSGKGCDDCRGTGYRGRTGIYELFVINEEARGLILSKKPSGVIRRHAIEHGMISLRDDGWIKARAGITTV